MKEVEDNEKKIMEEGEEELGKSSSKLELKIWKMF